MRRLQRVELPAPLDQTLATTALATTPLNLPTRDLIAWATERDASLMGGRIPGRVHRSAVAAQLIATYDEICARMTRAPLDANLVPAEDGLPWRAGDPLAGTLEVFAPFDHVGTWREIAGEAPLPRRGSGHGTVPEDQPDGGSPPPADVPPPAPGHPTPRPLGGGSFGIDEANRTLDHRRESGEHLETAHLATEGVHFGTEIAGLTLGHGALAFAAELAGVIGPIVAYWLTFENILARHEAEAHVFAARTALWGMLGTAQRDAVPQPLDGHHLLYGAHLRVRDWYHQRNEVAARVILDWREVQKIVEDGCADIADRLQAVLGPAVEEHLAAAVASGRAPEDARAEVDAGLKTALRQAGRDGLERIRAEYAERNQNSH